jgi:hypothetical protein
VTVSTAFKREVYDPETSQAFLLLLTIDHTDIDPPIRVVNNTEDVTSRGDEFIAYPFELQLPDNVAEAPPRAKLVIDNVSREIAQSIRLITSAPTVLIELIRASVPNTVEVSFPLFALRDIKWDMLTVSGELVLEDLMSEPFPADQFTPAYFPGLF